MSTTMPQHRTCPICLDPLIDTANVVALPCGHFLHATCGIDYFRRVADNRCLECRAAPDNIVDNDESKEWKYWTSVRNREARRDPIIRRLRQEFWDSRAWLKKEKKRLLAESERIERATRCLGMCEEKFDNAVLASLRDRNSRILNRAGAEPLPR